MKLLAFDCDGTILDTTKDYAAAINYTLSRYNMGQVTLSQIQAFLGYGTDHLVRESLRAVGAPDGTFEGFKRDYLERYFSNLVVHTHEYPGITDFLLEAKRRGYRLAVVSNKPDPAVRVLMERCFPKVSFEAVKGQGEGERPKPYPDLLFAVLKDLGIAPEDTAYFGDTEVDARFAHAAGTGALYICTWGFRERGELLRTVAEDGISPTAVLDSVSDLYRAL